MSIGRLVNEIKILHRVLDPADFRAAIGFIASRIGKIVARRNLSPLDQAMGKDISINFRGIRLNIPVEAVDRLLLPRGDNATFGAVREMFGSDVYLRAFKPLPNVKTVVDLGGNRGFFSLIAAKILGASQIVTVEPTEAYNACFAAIAEANGISKSTYTRINKFVGATDDDKSVSLEKIIADNNITRIDFLKSDIEGSEYATFKDNPETVRKICNLAMEVHPWCGSTANLAEFLSSTGLVVMLTDQFGHIVSADKALYLYASREGQLTPPFYSEGLKGLSSYSK